jgi:hypothetical protein
MNLLACFCNETDLLACFCDWNGCACMLLQWIRLSYDI